MTPSLDMSLDDLIKNNKFARREGGRNGRGIRGRRGAVKTSWPSRRQLIRANGRRIPYATTKSLQQFVCQAPEGAWQHNMYENVTGVVPAPIRPQGIETGSKLYISNLDCGVSSDDIKELFSEVGDLKGCSIHYERNGRSKGTAEVVFSRKSDGVAALKRYNNVQLDGKAMKIEPVGANLTTSAVPPATSAVAVDAGALLGVTNGVTGDRIFKNRGVFGWFNPTPRRMLGVKGGTGTRGFLRGKRGYSRRGRGRRRKRSRAASQRKPTVVEKSAADLDAELESYHTEAMQT